MPRIPKKAPSQCPGCGFVQLEPPRLISTFCQSCGDFYTTDVSTPEKSLPGIKSSVGRRIHCHRCGTIHGVSLHALSTLCPGCSAAIELTDMQCLSGTSRAVDIRGHLHIGPAGSLSSSWIVCGSALIEGLIVGVLRCEGEVRLATKSPCMCRISSAATVVERESRIVLSQSLETGHLEVCGHLQGIIHCNGDVHVRRGGRLEAEVHARSVKVDKGGALLGACYVAETQPEEKCLRPSNGLREIIQPGQLCLA